MHGNRELLTDVLKQRLAFDGLIVSDWGRHRPGPGCRTTTACPPCWHGTDVFMVPLSEALHRQHPARRCRTAHPESRIDDAVRRIRASLRAGLATDGKVRETDATFATDADRAFRPPRGARVAGAAQASSPAAAPAGVIARARRGRCGDNIHNQTGGWSRTWQGHETTNADFPRRHQPAGCAAPASRQRQRRPRRRRQREDPGQVQRRCRRAGRRSPMPKMAGDIGLTSSPRHSRRYPEQLAALQRGRARRAGGDAALFGAARRQRRRQPLRCLHRRVAAGLEGAGLVDALVAPEAGKTWPGFTARLRFPARRPCQFSTHPDPKATGADKPWWPVGGASRALRKRPRPRRLCQEWPEPKGICPVL